MTSAQFWRALGRELLRERERRGWSLSGVARAGGLTYHVVQTQERGQIKTTHGLERHCAAFGWPLDGALRLLLEAHPPINGALLAFVTAYVELSAHERHMVDRFVAMVHAYRGGPRTLRRRAPTIDMPAGTEEMQLQALRPHDDDRTTTTTSVSPFSALGTPREGFRKRPSV